MCECQIFSRTDVGVHLGVVHGLHELAEARLVAVHLPVTTDKEFPAHVCGLVDDLVLLLAF